MFRQATDRYEKKTNQNLAQNARAVSFNIDCGDLRLLQTYKAISIFEMKNRRCKMCTICNKTSPGANASPSLIFQRVIVPSVINGDIAGIIITCLSNDP